MQGTQEVERMQKAQEAQTVEQIQESAGMRKEQRLQSMQKVQQLQIAGLCCDLVLPGDYERGRMRYPVQRNGFYSMVLPIISLSLLM